MTRLRYAIDEHRLGSRLTPLFVTPHADQDTLTFVAEERVRRHRRIRWAARAAIRPVVGAFSANALLDLYPLFMLSAAQWATLLAPYAGGHLLDVGSAAGHVTSRLAPLYDDVTATDVSRAMVRRLRARGMRAADWEPGAAELADTLEQHGLRIEAITRAPYLSGGDRRDPLYVLDAVIIVATRLSARSVSRCRG